LSKPQTEALLQRVDVSEGEVRMGDVSRLGVVTVTYNSAGVLDGFLASVRSQTYDNFTLYAIDNASRDATLEKLSTCRDERIKVIANLENVGCAGGYNQGTRAALGDGCTYVLHLNNDTEFGPTTFETLISEMNSLQCDLLGPKILYGDGVRIWSAGGDFSQLKGFLGFHHGQGEVDEGQFEKARPVRHSSGCCVLIHKRVFERIGMLDPKYFVYQEDTDFCLRAWRAGLLNCYTPRVTIVHKVSSLTGGEKSPFTMRYNARGHTYFMLKNLGLACLLYLPAWELRLIFKLLSGSISRSEFVIRQKGFIEGIGLWFSH